MKWVVAAATIATVARAQTGLDPPAFDAGRSDANTAFLFVFERDEVLANNITDYGAGNNFPLGASYDGATWSNDEKCPNAFQDVGGSSVEFENAHNGVQSSGTSGVNDDAVTTADDVSAMLTQFGSATAFTVEMWVRPAFNSGSDSNTYVLMEIGNRGGFTPGTPFTWEGDSQYDLQIAYDNNDEEVVVTYVTSGGSDSTIGLAAAGVFTSGSVHHVAVGLSTNGFFSVLMLFVDGVFVSSIGCPNLNTGQWTGTRVLRIGSSPATQTSTQPLSSWNGAVLLAAMHTSDVAVFNFGTFSIDDTSFVTGQFGAWLPNNPPVGLQGSTGLFTGTEDQFVTVPDTSMEELFYDLDTVTAKRTDPKDLSVTGLTTALFGGDFNVNGAGVSPLVFPFDITGTGLEYRNSVPNQYSNPVTTPTSEFGASFTLRANDGFADSPNIATMDVSLTATNDAPTGADMQTAEPTAQLTSQKLSFMMTDIDCLAATDVSCASFGLDRLVIDGPHPLGKLYEPDGLNECPGYDGTEVSFPFTFNAVGDVGPQTLELCFEACLQGDTQNDCPPGFDDSGVTLGTASYVYSVFDNDGDVSVTNYTVSTEISRVLEVGAPVTNFFLTEDTTGSIQLEGTDFYCEQTPEPSDCDRDKRFVLVSLPAPTEGELFLDAGLTQPAATGVEYDGLFFFRPAPNFFNRDVHPLCAQDGPLLTFTRCPNTGSTPDCAGPFCESHTTEDLGGNAMGGCGNPSSEGCGIELNYFMRVNSTEGVQLESLPAVGGKIWVDNVEDPASLSFPRNPVTGLKRNVRKAFTEGGNSIRLVDPDGDNRVVSLVIDVRGPNGLLSVGTANFNSERVRFVQGGPNKNNGVNTLGMIGINSEINLVLSELTYQIDVEVNFDAVDFSLEDPFDDTFPNKLPGQVFNTSLTSLNLEFTKADDDGGLILNLSTFAIWGIIGGGSLCFCLFFCGCALACVHKALRGERAAKWFVKNVLFTHIKDPEEKRIAVEHDMESAAHRIEQAVHEEHNRLERVQWCAHLISCLCPCCLKFDAKEDLVPKEEDMLIAVNDSLKDQIAENHLPAERTKSVKMVVPADEIFNWEKHSHKDERTGIVRDYYFNAVTGESSWTRPVVKARK